MSNLKNISNSVGNMVGTGTSSIAVGTKLLESGTRFLGKVVSATPRMGSAILRSPLVATEEYLVDSVEGLSREDAHNIAYKYANQPIEDTIDQISAATGSLMALLAKEDKVES